MTISVRGACTHNLANVDLVLEPGQVVAFVGVSGSGKSSLAFDTLFVEGQRRYLEAMGVSSATLQRPDVARVDGLPPTIALDQRPRAVAAGETLASLTGVHELLALLMARCGEQHCTTCGRPIRPLTVDRIVDELLAHPEGTRATIEAPIALGEGVLDEVARAGFSRVRIDGVLARLEELGEVGSAVEVRVVVDRVKLQSGKRDRLMDSVRTAAKAGAGVVVVDLPSGPRTFTDRPVCVHDGEEQPWPGPQLFDPRSLHPAAAAMQLDGRRFSEWLVSTAERLQLPELQDTVGAPLVAEVTRRLQLLEQLGLGRLSLGQSWEHLSAGEAQRARLAAQAGGALSGVLYVLDEPAAGLDRPLAGAVASVVKSLAERGNTVVVVTHARPVIEVSDLVVEFGPGAGASGGQIQARMAPKDWLETPAGQWFTDRAPWPERREHAPEAWFDVSPSMRLPLHCWTAITGPSGAGKSMLLATATERAKVAWDGRVAVMEASTSARSSRSMVATYGGLWTPLRELLAETREAKIGGLKPAMFSLARPGGRCEACQGLGERRVDLGPLPAVSVECSVCNGRRFQSDLLRVRWKGLAPDALLALSVDEARPMLSAIPKLEGPLRALSQVGLGYVKLGQSTASLSGGEMHRLKLANALGWTRRSGVQTLIVLDDPSRGLHPKDVALQVELFRTLTDQGATVWIATSDERLAGSADATVQLAG